MYLIVNCPRCGEPMLANTMNKTRSCPNCDYRSDIHTLRVLARVKSPKKAVKIIQAIKEKHSGEDWEPKFKRFKPKES